MEGWVEGWMDGWRDGQLCKHTKEWLNEWEETSGEGES